VLAGIQPGHLRDWRREATLLPPRLRYELNPKFNGAPTVTWCGLPVTRLWRYGNQGSVASVLIEKPARGGFLPILDGGFSLQYSPLMEFREGRGIVLFRQMDVTGRSEDEPAAATLAADLIAHLEAWQPGPEREAVYLGAPAGLAHLQAAGLRFKAPSGDEFPRDAVLQSAEHISAHFVSPGRASPLAGIGPAAVPTRDPRTLPLVRAGAEVSGDGVLAVGPGGNVVICQLAPWRFDYRRNFGL
jgi:hypothetical protein